MNKCYYCKSLVNSTNIKNAIYFCSKYCLEIATKTKCLYNRISNMNRIITNKLCYACYQKIDSCNPTYYYNDHIFCSDRCRGSLMNIC
jgi:endogenous inhibitor of DNA gyrase (YacG/DUF329 family)